MTTPTDFFKHAVCFQTPHRLTEISSWHGHIPFAFAIVQMLRPGVFVELGTHKGDSYCAFCQAVKKAELSGMCYAVDLWEGDEHAGFYGPEIFEELRAYHDPLYADFSKLLKMHFDDALARFPDAGTDLLHIDGLHSYHAVKHDFCSWLPKMSRKGVVLLHDTNVQGHGFGVRKFWAEVRETYPGFEFLHSNGLGVLGVGTDLPENVRRLLESDEADAVQIRRFFADLGGRIAYGIPMDTSEKREKAFNPESPKVSVIIPAYNHETYLKETIYSVLKQTVTDFELIIINDGSTDNSEAVIRSVEDERIRYVYQENQGAHCALNRGVRLAKGEYVSILNSDDVYCPDRFEAFLKILEQDDSVHAVFSHIEYIDDAGGFITYKKGSEENWIRHHPETSFKGGDHIITDLIAGNFLISTSNLFCRKSVFQEIGFFSDLKYAHDYDFFLRLCYHFKVHIIEKPLFKYRIHGKNTFNKSTLAEVGFEVGLVLSNFFLKYDLRKIFPERDIHTMMVKFFNSVNTFDSERMMMTVLFFGLMHKSHDRIFESVREDGFRKNCIENIQARLSLWEKSQEAWEKWHETNDRLINTDKKRASAEEEAEKWWMNSEEAWKKAEDAESRLSETQKKLSEANEESTKRWLDSQEAWKTVRENEDILTETVRKLSDMEEKTTKYWLDSQEAWRKWRETNERLMETIGRLSETEAEAAKWRSDSQDAWQKFRETDEQLTETGKRLSETKEEAAKWRSDSQEAWRKYHETDEQRIKTDTELSEARYKWTEISERLIDTERKLSDADQKIREKTEQFDMLLNSRTYRLGSVLAWPVRKIRKLLF